MSGELARFDFYPRDCFPDTRDLTREPKRVYIGLLAAIYARSGPLPHQPNFLHPLLGEKSVRVVHRIVGELIERSKMHLVNGWLVNNLASEEIQALHERQALTARGGGRFAACPPKQPMTMRCPQRCPCRSPSA